MPNAIHNFLWSKEEELFFLLGFFVYCAIVQMYCRMKLFAVFYVQAYVLDAHDIGVAHGMCYLESVSTRSGEYHVGTEQIAVVDILACALAIPATVGFSQRASQSVLGHASIGEGGVDEEECSVPGIVLAYSEVEEEGVETKRIGYLYLEVSLIVHIPTFVVHPLVVRVEHRLVAGGEGSCQKKGEKEYLYSLSHSRFSFDGDVRCDPGHHCGGRRGCCGDVPCARCSRAEPRQV